MAGKPKLNTEIAEKILRMIRQGVWLYVAAEGAGIARSTFHRWMEIGTKSTKRRDEIYRQFAQEVEMAKAEAEVKHTLNITRAAMGDPANNISPNWTASAWWLERRNPERYARREFVQHGGEVLHKQRTEIVQQIHADPEARRVISELLGRLRHRKDESSGVGDGGERRALGPGSPSNGGVGPVN